MTTIEMTAANTTQMDDLAIGDPMEPQLTFSDLQPPPPQSLNDIFEPIPEQNNRNDESIVQQSSEPLPQLGIEPALQQQLLNAIPPPSAFSNSMRSAPNEALPGEFPLCLPVVEEERRALPIDKIEATISINIPIPVPDTNSGTQHNNNQHQQSDLFQPPQLIPTEMIKTEKNDTNNNPITAVRTTTFTLPPKKAKFDHYRHEFPSVNRTLSSPSSGMPYTTMAPILFDSPIPLVTKDRSIINHHITSHHPDYPAISGLLSFIKHPEVPLSLSLKNSTITHSMVSDTSHSHSHPVPTESLPTAVPVSVVTSISDRFKVKSRKASDGQSGKLQLPPLLSGDPSKPFQCGLCGKHLASKNVYQLHLRSHSGEKPFTCSLCGHSFSQKTSLTRHMRSHTGERPFPCQICGKRFADKERIKIHMRTHTGEKPFACDVCGKQFSQKSTVKRHMSVHTGEKPFKCVTCGKGFANRGNLTAHSKTHSNT